MGDRQPVGDGLESRWPRYDRAVLGYRHYWYPVLESRKLRKRPHPLTLLGEKIVLVRDRGQAYALSDRCLHRGVPLSMGRREFPGRLTCCYHGWTYDLASGELVAALTDGPDSPICGNPELRVRTYPVEERAGLIWIYVGDEPRPPVEEDIPASLLRSDAVVAPMVDPRDGNWRYAMENAVDDAHAKYLHRNNLWFFFTRLPGYGTAARMAPSEDGKWLRRVSTPEFRPADYPGVGKWPKHDFWRWRGRRFKADKGSGSAILGGACLPGIFSVGHENWEDFQIFVPVDEDRHLMLQVSVRHTKGLGVWLWRLRYWTYIRLIHHIMFNRWEDGRVVPVMSEPEHLFRPDMAIVHWRRWCHENARRSPAEPVAAGPAELNAG